MCHRLQSCRRGTAAWAAVVCFTMVAPDAIASDASSDRLVVHEWGTFTSLQDENGQAIGGINVDDEPLPDFVHRIANFLMLRPGVAVPIFAKGTPRCHPHVTMRLETPVVYFHPAPEEKLPIEVDVEVAFRSGWLSEYYPDAAVEAPGVKGHTSFGPITGDTLGRLTWRNLQVGTEGLGPETSSPVWLAPRAVDAANVSTVDGESERYLFYRGVGRVESPMRVSRDTSDQSLVLTAHFPAAVTAQPGKFAVPTLWLVEIRDDGTSAFREIPGFEIAGDGKPQAIATIPGQFADAEFDEDNLQELTAAMRSTLVEDGLFGDEADALLGTWKHSYFQTPGLRLFYLLPQAWTDQVLPLTISPAAEVVRTMVGRVEIVTPQQRQLLSRIAAGPASTPELRQTAPLSCFVQPAKEPENFAAYRELGRFRNALVLDELARRPTPGLKSFIDGYGLWGYTPRTPATAPAAQ